MYNNFWVFQFSFSIFVAHTLYYLAYWFSDISFHPPVFQSFSHFNQRLNKCLFPLCSWKMPHTSKNRQHLFMRRRPIFFVRLSSRLFTLYTNLTIESELLSCKVTLALHFNKNSWIHFLFSFYFRFVKKSILWAAWWCCRVSISWNTTYVSQYIANNSRNDSRSSFIIVFRFTVSSIKKKK